MKDGIRVAYAPDPQREAREREMEERAREATTNPLQRFGDALVNSAKHVYSEYLYLSGTAFIVFAWWAAYPAFARYRHKHIARYRRKQIIFKQGFFRTQHIPTWNKKYMQRIVVPPPRRVEPPPQAQSAKPSTSASSGTALQKTENDAAAVALHPDASEHMSDFTKNKMTVRISHTTQFNRSEDLAKETQLQQRLQAISDEHYGPQELKFSTSDRYKEHNPASAREEIESAISESGLVCVLKEDHSSVQSIPEGWEVWWVSLDEAKRLSFCKWWLTTLLVWRALQDLLYMPDMPPPGM